MNTINETQIERAEEILNQLGIPMDADRVKIIKTIDKDLIERKGSSKIILAEDSKILLND